MFRRLTSTTTTFAYTSSFLLREAASISTMAISFDFALPQLIYFLAWFRPRHQRSVLTWSWSSTFYTILPPSLWLSLLLHCLYHCCTFPCDDRAHPQLPFKKKIKKIDKENKWKNHTIKYNKIIFTCRFAWK